MESSPIHDFSKCTNHADFLVPNLHLSAMCQNEPEVTASLQSRIVSGLRLYREYFRRDSASKLASFEGERVRSTLCVDYSLVVSSGRPRLAIPVTLWILLGVLPSGCQIPLVNQTSILQPIRTALYIFHLWSEEVPSHASVPELVHLDQRVFTRR
jgi:hypothetical protein